MPIGPLPEGMPRRVRGKRMPVSIFTFQSMRRARLHMDLYGHLYSHVIDLTYPGGWITQDARLEESHKRRFIQWLERIGVKDYFWAKEYQTRGALHFHVLVDRFIDKDLIRARWARIIGGLARTRIDVIRSRGSMGTYIINYWSKPEQKTIPEGVTGHGRWWGSNRAIKPLDTVTLVYHDPFDCKRLMRPLDKYYDTKLREWGKRAGRVYKRHKKRVGFLAFGLADQMERVLYRSVAYGGCPDVVL